MNLTARAKLIT